MPIPTRRLWLLIGIAAVPFAAALFLPGLSTLGLLIDTAILVVALLDMLFLPRPTSFEARIALDRVVSLGETERIHIEIRNVSSARGRAWMRLVLPDTWRGSPEPLEFALQPRRSADLVVTAQPQRRGRAQLGPVHLRVPSFIGLFNRDIVCPAQRETKVYPAVTSIRKYQLLVREMRIREMGFRPQRLRGQGMEFSRLREYQHDDDPRLVDWKATARRGHLISREYQVERSQTILFLLDAGRMLTEEVDGLVKFEYALHAALLLARVAADYDDRVGAVVFSDRIERSVMPRKGRAAVTALAEALFDTEPKLVESDYDAAFEHVHVMCRKRALIVLITNLVDQETSGLVHGYLAGAVRRHVPVCVAIGDRETTEVAHSVPKTEQDVYMKAAACRLLSARGRTLQDLQRRGVHVIDAVSGQVPIALVNRYLDLKARQLL